MDMKSILDTLQTAVPSAVATSAPAKKPKTLEELFETPFTFSTAQDKVGLPMEHKTYVKRGCNDCYGRGYVIQTGGGRRYQTCGCLNRGYVKTRRAVEAEADQLVKLYGLTREAALKQAVESLGL